MVKKLIIALLFFPATVFAQITDNFEDGDITDWTESNVGRWEASTLSPLSGTYSLHHIFDNTSGDHDQVSFDIPDIDLSADLTMWRFRIKYDYNPSGGNNWNVFLSADADASEMFPSGVINGYALGVNFAETDDTLRLYKITSGIREVIISSSLNWEDDTDPSDISALEVTRSSSGDWEIKYNSTGDFASLTNIGTGTDNTYTLAEYFGIYYLYTSSADKKLWIDDIEITGQISIDNDSPLVDSLIILSSTSLMLDFSEVIDSALAVDVSNYNLNNGIGRPDSVKIDGLKKSVEIYFTQSLVNKTYYNLDIKNLEDVYGNVISDTSLNFLYYKPEKFDILINELMVDPNPVIDLPEYEYIEIYNTTIFDIDITDWTLTVGTNVKTIPSATLRGEEYIILCSEDAKVDLETYGTVVSLPSFPTLANSGQTVTIKTDEGEQISSVAYTDEWYKDEYKAEGGWSLEQIDPLNPCGGENNWKASESSLGGTPGQENSVNASNPDNESPELLRIAIFNEKQIQLFFSEIIDSISASKITIYDVDNGVGNPISALIQSQSTDEVILEFSNDFIANTIYSLQIAGGIFDCAGNEISDKNTAQFAIPSGIETNDVVINEILFNPYPDGNDFVEIYNRSEKIIDLQDVYTGTYDADKGTFVGVEQISTQGYLFFPGQYLVLSESTENIQELYYTNNPDGFIEVSNLPSLNDDMGRIILFDKILTVIDDLEYNEDTHYPLLASNEGVSLERINFDRPTLDESNWHSASEAVGFATPAYENSQFLETEDLIEKVQIEPEVFSPDNDGFDDIVNISLSLNEPGYVANIKIYDSKGRLVRYLSNNLLLGINPTITWDGLNENNQKALVGVYVVFIELFDLDGNVTQYKESVVVAAKW